MRKLLLAVPLLAACGTISPSSLEFVAINPATPKLNDIATIQFKATDSRGQPMAGVEVTFKLQNAVPGVTLNPPVATTNKGDGIASTQLIASGFPTSVVVIATAGDKTALSPGITFAGKQPSARQFTFQCGKIAGIGTGGIHAVQAYDESRYLIAGVKLRCQAHVADRNGDGIPGVEVSFLAEAGAIGTTATTQTDAAGNAEVIYKTGYPVPKETTPGTFKWNPTSDATHMPTYLAPLWMHPYEWHPNPLNIPGGEQPGNEPFREDPIRPDVTGQSNKCNVNNPRDNLVTLVAITTGEEGFTDTNNNGVWDLGEPWDDLTEPFVDANDNGTWDVDEQFVDTNGPEAPDNLPHWNGKNGKWDSSTLIWTQERILWTGLPADEDFTGANSSANCTLTQPVRTIFRQTALAPLPIPHFGSAIGSVDLCDPWFNSLAKNGDSDGCTIAGSKAVVADPATIDGPGIAFTYPACIFADVQIADAHDPTQAGPDGGPLPPNNPPIPFTVYLTCNHTASPEDQFRASIPAGAFSGTVY